LLALAAMGTIAVCCCLAWRPLVEQRWWAFSRQRDRVARIYFGEAETESGEIVGKSGASVPFFMFEGEPFNVLEKLALAHPRLVQNYSYKKNGAEIWWLRGLVSHPWRTHDWRRADVIVLPLPIGFCRRRRDEDVCGSLVPDAIAAIKSHPSFGRADDRYMVLSTEYKLRRSTLDFPRFIMGTKLIPADPFVGQRCSVQVPMITMSRLGVLGELEAPRPIRTFFIGQADARPSYKDRMWVHSVVRGESASSTSIDIFALTARGAVGLPLCAEDCYSRPPGCINCKWGFQKQLYHDLLRRSQFAWHMAGDTEVSNRIYDILTAAAIPILVGNRVDSGLPFQHRVPWNKMSVRAPANLDGNFLRQLTSFDPEWIAAKRAAVVEHRGDLLWQVDTGRVAANVLRDAKDACIPGTG